MAGAADHAGVLPWFHAGHEVVGTRGGGGWRQPGGPGVRAAVRRGVLHFARGLDPAHRRAAAAGVAARARGGARATARGGDGAASAPGGRVALGARRGARAAHRGRASDTGVVRRNDACCEFPGQYKGALAVGAQMQLLSALNVLNRRIDVMLGAEDMTSGDADGSSSSDSDSDSGGDDVDNAVGGDTANDRDSGSDDSDDYP